MRAWEESPTTFSVALSDRAGGVIDVTPVYIGGNSDGAYLHVAKGGASCSVFLSVEEARQTAMALLRMADDREAKR